MRLGVVTTSYPRWPGDPAGCFVAEHAAWARAAGWEVEVVAAGDRDTFAEPGVHRVDSRGLFYRGGAPEALEHRRAWSPAARVSAAMLAEVARRGRPFGRAQDTGWDAVVAHWLAPSAIAAAIATRAPLTAIAHSGDVHLLCRARLAGATAALLRARRATVVFVSAALRERFAAACPPPLAAWVRAMPVSSMGVDLARFAAARAGDDDRAGALFLGRLVPIKGVDTLVDAASAASTRIAIAGDGPERERLVARAGDRVDWLGEIRGVDRDRALGRARVVVVPSVPRPDGRTEGTPRVALEAMAAGAPVIASATGGLAELPPGVITLVPPGDARALAAAVDRLADFGDARRGQIAAADRFVASLDWSKVGPILMSAFHDPRNILRNRCVSA